MNLLEPDAPLTFLTLISGIIFLPPDFKTIIGLVVLLILLMISAFMSGSEVAYFSMNPTDIQKLKHNKSNRAQVVLKLYNIPEKLLSTILVANNTVNIAIVILSAFITSKTFDFSSSPIIGFLIQVVIITLLLLLFGEIMPKIYATRNHMAFALLMAYPLVVIEKIFRPITAFLIFSSSFVKNRTGHKGSNISMSDLSDALELTSDEFREDEKILKGILNFGNINVSAVMCPRIDVIAIDIKSGFKKVLPVIIESGFSRIPVYSGSFDNMKGILYAKDVLPYINNPDNFKWQALLRPPYFVPETKRINDLLKEFQIKKMHMAVVIDEFGGTSGIISLEDILEEIVGEITDETDEDETKFKKIDDHTYIFDGKVLINDFCKILNVAGNPFEEVRGESETLAGLLLELTGVIPQKDRTIDYSNFLFKVESADKRRIKEIRVTLKGQDA
jgi:putative hemolysin